MILLVPPKAMPISRKAMMYFYALHLTSRGTEIAMLGGNKHNVNMFVDDVFIYRKGFTV